ncbi:hypothetical protein KL921_002175 [Ogataea angusta]|uniref:Prefoldin subunit 6 n=1 Tax=Pichia angusta TaxID=870730 RepID=A0AAN6I6A3_PICAN|nr:uncharacterized protein KL928_002357 [Ogataea angusta]KAG7811909.1 hypothetical protein KL921_002175 [Ogataea angusta]KAG7819683.1 hypothetical protein KL928_002357 [Ogataea angusta]KAG7824464.1 hypothetical protein KL909_002462 [Ogataea angusta]KAG7830747.1 hypothetical protein KL920_001338 [Ogataea angusta]KAG7834964.1 hypothetical protein KL943_002279 [Ogataea angusta]
MEDLSKQYTKLQAELTELVRARQKLETQFQENKIVKQEFDTLDDDAKIYKLVGPVLLPQDNAEANLNVDKRIEFINSDIKRVEEKIQQHQQDLSKLQGVIMSAPSA